MLARKFVGGLHLGIPARPAEAQRPTAYEKKRVNPDTMSESCKARYRWTRQELTRAMLHHQRRKLRAGVVLFAKIVSAILLIFIGIVLLAWMLLPSTSAPPFWAILILVLVSVYCLMFDKVNVWSWGRGFAARPDADLEIEWEFSREEIRSQTELGKASVNWRSFLTVVETSDGFLFYPLKNFFHWIPFSAFESDDCIERVRRFVKENDIPLVNKQSKKRLRPTE